MENNPSTPSKYLADTLPQEILCSIGEIIYRWSCVQLELTHLIAYGFNIPIPTSRALTVGMEINVMCNVLRTLTISNKWIKDNQLRLEVKKLGEDIQKNIESRNNYAHGVFVFNLEDPNKFERYLIKKGEHRILPSTEKVELHKLQEIANTAKELIHRAVDLTLKLKASLKKSP